ncbi:MAG: hypothetical protein MI919_10745 [Holophagales bacterium]|nr:hypothetical protein [Holophagales bacterium]
MRSVLPPLLLLVAIVSYFVLAVQFGFYQRYPWPNLLLIAAALAWQIAETVKRRSWARATVAVLMLLLGATYTWYVLDYSSYPASAGVPEAGTTLGELTELSFPNQRGETSPLLDAAVASRATLLVLYRGHW